MSQLNEQICQGYLELFANLTPERISEFSHWVSEDIHFRDPFNDVYGIEAMQAILLDMFERSEEPKFDVLEHSLDGSQAYLRWNFRAKIPVIGRLDVEGVSRICFGADGRITEHLDYWDSAPIYLRLPLLGALLRRLKSKMALPAIGQRAESSA